MLAIARGRSCQIADSVRAATTSAIWANGMRILTAEISAVHCRIWQRRYASRLRSRSQFRAISLANPRRIVGVCMTVDVNQRIRAQHYRSKLARECSVRGQLADATIRAVQR